VQILRVNNKKNTDSAADTFDPHINAGFLPTRVSDDMDIQCSTHHFRLLWNLVEKPWTVLPLCVQIRQTNRRRLLNTYLAYIITSEWVVQVRISGARSCGSSRERRRRLCNQGCSYKWMPNCMSGGRKSSTPAPSPPYFLRLAR